MSEEPYRIRIRIRLELGADGMQRCLCGSDTFTCEESGIFTTLELGKIEGEDFNQIRTIASQKSVEVWTYRCKGCMREVLPWAP